MAEDDELERGEPHLLGAEPVAEDNSFGRLLTLTDGVFAIALTLLAIDLKVPDLSGHVTEHQLVKELGANAGTYWSYLLTFYVITQYWLRHRRVLRSVTVAHPALIRDTLILLFVVAAMPFPASLLGSYGGLPISLALYGAANVVAMVAVMLTSWDIRRFGLAKPVASGDVDYDHKINTWLTLGVFVLCIPAGFVLGSKGPYVLLLLVVAGRIPFRRRR
jgi:uncharacterized membrane protein